MRLMILLALPLTLAACGANKTGSEPAKDAQFTYSLKDKVNGVECATGRITATDVKTLCQALRDEEINQKCAADQRLELQRKHNCSNQTPVETTSFYFGACEKTTGLVVHVASFEAQCEALKNEKLNGGCAKEERANQAFAHGCR